jgi:hypothetical protein
MSEHHTQSQHSPLTLTEGDMQRVCFPFTCVILHRHVLFSPALVDLRSVGAARAQRR